MKKALIFLMVLSLLIGAVQQGYAVSEAAVLFLMISPGARASGMGEAFVATADDATAVFWNPAGLAYLYGKEITIMHANWLPQFAGDMYYDFLAYRQDIEGVGTIGANVTFLNMGKQTITGESGPDPLGEFSSYDIAFSGSYGTTITENFAMGVSLRYIRSNLAPQGQGAEIGEGKANAFAFDVGLLYKFPFLNNRLSWGMNLSNMGPKIAYIDVAQADPLPTNLKTGLAFKLVDTNISFAMSDMFLTSSKSRSFALLERALSISSYKFSLKGSSKSSSWASIILWASRYERRSVTAAISLVLRLGDNWISAAPGSLILSPSGNLIVLIQITVKI